MKLSQVFEQLTYGELSQLSLGGGEVGMIVEENYRHVANHVVLGLTALYKRFTLKENQLLLELMDDVTFYTLQSKYAVNGKFSTEPKRWIIDTVAAPFGDDILKVKRVVATDTGFELSLNTYSDELTVTTPTMDSLRVPKEIVTPTTSLAEQLRTGHLTLIYQANHPGFLPRVGFFDPELIDIELPMTHLQALLYFVASRAHNPIGMTQEFNAGNNWAARYEQECKRLEDDGNEVDQGSQPNRARRNGWV